MTANEIANRKQKEEVRHDKQEESIGFRKAGAAMGKAGSDILKTVIGAANDPSWYNSNAAMVANAANISYYTPLGAKSGLPSRESNTGTENTAISGILNIDFVSTIGSIDGIEASAINIAAYNIYSFVRYTNSGARNYYAPDLMLYLQALDSAYTFYAYMIKIYALLNQANAQNWYYQRPIIQSMGFDFKALQKDIASLCFYINSFAQRLSAFNVPNNLPVMLRHMWLTGSLFKDSEITRSQLYNFVPKVFYVFDNEDGKLVATQIQSAPNSNLEHIQLMGESILTGLFNSEDIGIISGDILKAYQPGNMFTLGMLDQGYTITPVFSQEVLTQINGATACGYISKLSLLDIQQNDNGFIYQGSLTGTVWNAPTFNITQTVANLSTPSDKLPNTNLAVINQYKDGPSPDDNMVATRLTVTGRLGFGKVDGEEVFYLQFTPNQYATEIIMNLNIITLKADGNYLQDVLQTINLTDLSVAGDLPLQLQMFGKYVKFSWAPIVYFDIRTADTTSSFVTTAGYNSFDACNYAVITSDNLRNIHSTALQSLYGVPLLGNISNKATAKPSHSAFSTKQSNKFSKDTKKSAWRKKDSKESKDSKTPK